MGDKSGSIQPYYGVIDACDLVIGRENPNYKFGFKKTPEEKRAEREEQQRREQEKYGRYMSATDWIKLNGLGYLGRDKSIRMFNFYPFSSRFSLRTFYFHRHF